LRIKTRDANADPGKVGGQPDQLIFENIGMSRIFDFRWKSYADISFFLADPGVDSFFAGIGQGLVFKFFNQVVSRFEARARGHMDLSNQSVF